ncbi:FAD-dependent oxidoreductase [Streptomyces sp. V2I9]|uniref:FAD-dependent oxidoreductase n=1 Tax=Streptomyces sp. V2I9 TaxID=3042304 RepID=UPI0027853558|nr:FAD-dependent oxidoreductase [Streptomyces sp. V2I9]MDQ0985270.1 ferredoxin--NADP+ reductase [Streptomyces sp. V2I9]
MTYAITQTCCNDATCVAVCPVNCIHPTPEERAFGSTEMLHIDPRACIDCGACADACPVDAIFPVDSLTGGQREYAEINAAYYAGDAGPPAGAEVEGPNFHVWGEPVFERSLPSDFGPLRVAVVGTGPAGMYAAQDLLLHTAAEVTLIDRLPVAGGLVRYGVAPDHPATKKVGDTFSRFHSHPRVRMHLGIEVGRDVTAEELSAHHDAVVYAVGASTDKRLGVPGEETPGCLSATAFVAWYNAHPEAVARGVDLSAERIVVVGNGNVALDVARILVADPEALAATDIAAHALDALRASRVREVVVLGRRGPEDAAYTRSELLALKHLPGVELVVDDHDPRTAAAIDAAGPGDRAGDLRGLVRVRTGTEPCGDSARRIVLRFHSEAVEILGGEDGVRSVRVTDGGGDGTADLRAGLLLRAIGYRGLPVPGLPFDEAKGTVPHEGGRIAGMPGSYVVGWIKRGPSGGIGANRTCAAETVGTLLADAVAGTLPAPTGDAKAFRRLARQRNRRVVDARGLAAIDRAERERGRAAGRPRVKLATVEELVATARSRRLLRLAR